ncbi:hypothetical protein V6N13_132580 [Hibiscus sabdariffa]
MKPTQHSIAFAVAEAEAEATDSLTVALSMLGFTLWDWLHATLHVFVYFMYMKGLWRNEEKGNKNNVDLIVDGGVLVFQS